MRKAVGIAPPRIKGVDVMLCWSEPPPELSERCRWWVRRIKAGWTGNRRTASMGYHVAAEYYGVYIWEYLNVISPLLRENNA